MVKETGMEIKLEGDDRELRQQYWLVATLGGENGARLWKRAGKK